MWSGEVPVTLEGAVFHGHELGSGYVMPSNRLAVAGLGLDPGDDPPLAADQMHDAGHLSD
jgi:hypothetical protein